MTDKKDRVPHDWSAPLSRRAQTIIAVIAGAVILAALLYLVLSGRSLV